MHGQNHIKPYAYVSPSIWETMFHTQTTGKIIFLCISIFIFFFFFLKMKDSAPNDSRHFFRSYRTFMHSMHYTIQGQQFVQWNGTGHETWRNHMTPENKSVHGIGTPSATANKLQAVPSVRKIMETALQDHTGPCRVLPWLWWHCNKSRVLLWYLWEDTVCHSPQKAWAAVQGIIILNDIIKPHTTNWICDMLQHCNCKGRLYTTLPNPNLNQFATDTNVKRAVTS
jgi:hypothetical protein